MAKKLIIIDGSGYIFRAYYAIRALSTTSGEPTNAVYGFTTMIEKAIRDERPEYIAIAFDTGGPNFRRELYPDYKAHRPPPPEDLPRQIPRIHQIAEAFRLKTFLASGFEADDVIATLTRRGLEEGFDVHLITGDKDLMQLVSDNVEVYEPMKNARFRPKDVEEKFGVPPNKLLDALALSGDASDNVPGVSGVGMKTAAKLLGEWGDLEGVLSAAQAGKVKGKIGASLVAEADRARVSKNLIMLRDDVPLAMSLEELRYPGPDRQALRSLFVELEFRRLIPDIDAVAEAAPTPSPSGGGEGGVAMAARSEGLPGQPVFERSAYRTVEYAADLERLAKDLAGATRVGIAIETHSERAVDAMVLGIAFSTGPGQGAYVPLIPGDLTAPRPLAFDDVLRAVRPMLEDVRIAKVSAESKLLSAITVREGLALGNLAFDPTIADYLLEPDDTSHGFGIVSRRYLAHEPLDRTKLLPKDRQKLGFAGIPREMATHLLAERAEIAWRAMDAMTPELVRAELEHVLRDVELPLVPVLARMELAGVRIDVSQLEGMSERFTEELITLEKACYEAAGKEFNIGSPKQLQKILFEELGLKIGKRTKTGPSTDHSVLEALADAHPLPQAILDYRQVQKLKSTYVDALPRMVCPKTGRVHTVFSQTVAATGRLSSTEPNVQNIPIRSELGRQLRKVFVADPGHLLVSVDYSQIELRVLAHFSEDPILLDAFTRGIDVHTRTAAALFEIDTSEVTREQRTQAKAVNFGVLYGMGPVRLARDLKIPRRTASKFVEDYFEHQKGVKKYVDDTVELARKQGFVRTLLGRRRFVPEINSNNRGARSAAERIAINTPIQGSAADLIKLAMIRLDARLREEHLGARILLQVHDELLVETPEGEADAVARLVKHEMEHVYPLKVPLAAEAHLGRSWDEAH